MKASYYIGDATLALTNSGYVNWLHLVMRHCRLLNDGTLGTTLFYLPNLLIRCCQFSWIILAITHLRAFLIITFSSLLFLSFHHFVLLANMHIKYKDLNFHLHYIPFPQLSSAHTLVSHTGYSLCQTHSKVHNVVSSFFSLSVVPV